VYSTWIRRESVDRRLEAAPGVSRCVAFEDRQHGIRRATTTRSDAVIVDGFHAAVGSFRLSILGRSGAWSVSKSYGMPVNGLDRVSVWEGSSTDGAECCSTCRKSCTDRTIAKCV